ncbi:MAG: hypothetical protein ACLQB4_02965 [Beijerinckiaceae bacterium]
MTANQAKLEDTARQNLRLNPDVRTAIDEARLHRPGSVSRNTWITEAIVEKLAREQDNGAPPRKVGGTHV